MYWKFEIHDSIQKIIDYKRWEWIITKSNLKNIQYSTLTFNLLRSTMNYNLNHDSLNLCNRCQYNFVFTLLFK